MPAGYSGTPLARKLGYGPGAKAFLINPPTDYMKLVAPLPEGVVFAARRPKSADLVHLFTASKARLEKELPPLMKMIAPAGAIWVSWPKKASGVATTLFEEDVRGLGLRAGLVDIKVCAVDAVWSGLKFVIPVKDRT